MEGAKTKDLRILHESEYIGLGPSPVHTAVHLVSQNCLSVMDTLVLDSGIGLARSVDFELGIK